MRESLSAALLRADWVGVVEITGTGQKAARVTADGLVQYYPPPDRTMTFKVLRVLYGKPDPAGEASVSGHFSYELGSLRSGDRYLLSLSSGHVILDGSGLYKPDFERRVVEMVAGKPAWSAVNGGVSVGIMPSRFQLSEEEDLDLFFIAKNVSTGTIRLLYASTPTASHTHWELLVDRSDRSTVQPKRHPDYGPIFLQEFERAEGRQYQVDLGPGELSHTFYLPRINSAKPGWGYKDELDFSYYPMPPGKYAIRARAIGLLKDYLLESEPIKVVVRPSSSAVSARNLPSIEDSTELSALQEEKLRTGLRDVQVGDWLNNVAQQTVAEALPKPLIDACGTMPKAWRQPQSAKAQLRSRVVYIYEGDPLRMLLAVRCEVGPQEVDERLAALDLTRGRGRLLSRSYYPGGTTSRITDIRATTPIRVDGRETAGIAFTKTTKNPCCSSSSRCESEDVAYLFFDKGEVRQITGFSKRHDCDGSDQIPYPCGQSFNLTMKTNSGSDGNVSQYSLIDPGGKQLANFVWDKARMEFDNKFYDSAQSSRAEAAYRCLRSTAK